MRARTIMVQGTASSVGKSILVTALCRYFVKQGARVAPFKSQNMALNAFVTPDGGEIGRAQAIQAEAAGVAPTVDMNPILLKPEGEARSQVVVMGKAIGRMSAMEYHEHKPMLRETIAAALERLRATYDVVVIEGAGSPAEINLRARDLVNMHVAKVAEAPVLLAGDIDRGGVFAAFVGTMELLEPEDRARVAGFIVNKFRGDRRLLEPGLDFLEKRTGVPVAGVLPFLPRLRVAEEDSVSLDQRVRRPRPSSDVLDIVVVRFPRISNYDDLAPLEYEPGVSVRFVESAASARDADLLVLPGTKSTIADLAWLRASGLADLVTERSEKGLPTLGICGGCQMLGRRIDDPDHVEAEVDGADGLGILPLSTRFSRSKTTAQSRGRTTRASFLGPAGLAVQGYEIRMGDLVHDADADALDVLESRNGSGCHALDGAVARAGNVVGTMVHGLFDDDTLRRSMLTELRRRRGLDAPADAGVGYSKNAEYDRLADAIAEHVDVALLARLTGIDPWLVT